MSDSEFDELKQQYHASQTGLETKQYLRNKISDLTTSNTALAIENARLRQALAKIANNSPCKHHVSCVCSYCTASYAIDQSPAQTLDALNDPMADLEAAIKSTSAACRLDYIKKALFRLQASRGGG